MTNVFFWQNAATFGFELACYYRYLLISYFCFAVSYNEKDIFVLLLEGLVSLLSHHRTIHLQLLRH